MLSCPWLLGEILRWLARPKTVTHPSISPGGRESNSRPSSREPNALTTWWRGVVASVVRRMNEVTLYTSGPVSTGMGDRLWAVYHHDM